MTGYHLASVADRFFLDPQGFIMLPGYRMGRTYFKDSLEKLGLGFDEWRFFKYKSAFESYSRESMSDPDREQNQDFVDDWYEMVREQVCRSRGFTADRFDRLIDEEVFFTPDKAVSLGLVDSLARWSAKDDILKTVNGHAMRPLPATALLKNELVEQRWGPKPVIAVVYGLGVCDMDTGIRGR